MAFLLQKWGYFALFYRFYSKNVGLPGYFSSLQAFFVFSTKIQIVHFIPLSFNLWGIVQLLIRLKELLIFNGLCDIINSPINKNLTNASFGKGG